MSSSSRLRPGLRPGLRPRLRPRRRPGRRFGCRFGVRLGLCLGLLAGYLLAAAPAGLAAAPAGSARAAADAAAGELKLDPLLRHEMEIRAEKASAGERIPARPICTALTCMTDAAGETRIPCWISLEPGASYPAWLATGFRHGALATARPTFDEIARLAADPAVRTIHAAVRLRPSLNVSLPEIRADIVHAGTGTPPQYSGLSGSGVLVGAIDSGIDFLHEDFRTAAGTRLVYIWDQSDATPGHTPVNFAYGREWSAAQINAGLCTEQDTVGHGTHVLGIAAGNGRATGRSQPAYTYVGVAPEAALVAVKSIYSSASIADAVDYIFGVADGLGVPAVVNLSMGSHHGPHDGSEELEQAMDALAGRNHIVVAAAGNEEQARIHAESLLHPGESGAITLQIPTYQALPGIEDDYALIDGYYPATAAITLTVRAPGGATAGPVTPGNRLDLSTSEGAVLIENGYGTGEGGHLYIQVYDRNALTTPASGTWTLTLHETSGPAGSSASLDFWIYAYTIGAQESPATSPVFVTGMTARRLVASPAGADSVIAVGAYVTRKQWLSMDGNNYAYTSSPVVGQLADFSNTGPRRDGVIKPDIAAPGMGIGSALSASYSTDAAWILSDGVHVISQGTSMAAPHVTGLVALMLQGHPDPSVLAVLTRLKSNARSDGFTGALPDSAWGWGKIDAVGATTEETPVLLESVSAVRHGTGVTLDWRVPLDLASTYFQVWRSLDGDAEELRGASGPGPEYSFSEGLPTAALEARYWLAPLAGGTAHERWGPYLAVEAAGLAPLVFGATAPHPSPFVTVAEWAVTIPSSGEIRCDLFDPSGRLIRSLRSGPAGPGPHTFLWDGRAASGASVPSGVYWVRSRWNGREARGRILRLRPGRE